MTDRAGEPVAFPAGEWDGNLARAYESQVTDVTYQRTANGARVALRRMLPQDSGHIVNVCSAVAFRGMPLLSSYSGAKHAVRGFGQSVCAELAQDGSQVRLTTIFPPAVNTPFCDHAVSQLLLRMECVSRSPRFSKG